MDHALVTIEQKLEEDVELGPGLTKVNSAVLENPVYLIKVRRESTEML